MGELVAIRAQVHHLDASSLLAYFEDASHRASKVDGFFGGRLYRETVDPSDNLILWHYRDVQAAEEGLRQISKGPALPQRQIMANAPADVTRARVLHSGGLGRDHLPDGPYLSISVRIADPGFGRDLASELERIFTELHYLPGFRGYMVAVNDTLDEELTGLATWDTPEAFSASIPTGTLYQVRLYGLVATSSASSVQM